MSNLVQVENLKQIVKSQEKDFNVLAKVHNAVNFARESGFALQLLENNSYLMGIAQKNLDSLKYAVLNVAAIGLSLSPVHKLAYLVPRSGRVCLDISYLGLIQLATESGSIKYCVADVVYEKDTFKFNGMGKEITHAFSPFATDRGRIVGAYCSVKTPDGEWITITMTIDEIEKIRSRSEAGKKNEGPWKTDFNEMAKKTVIKRASKSWPKVTTQASERLAKAIEIDDQDYVETTATQVESVDLEALRAQIKGHLETIGRTEEAFLGYLSKVCRREIKSINDLTEIELKQQVTALEQMVEKKQAEVKQKEQAMAELDKNLGITNENAG
jgi:recombination protein RecT